ncbi:7TM diverse intracellular signaling domain-containing protein [Variovorax sp. J31P179]|uniref:sensor histidine kinase n=1 Tax=Variovorax sp. J31P179 TaxID=3053508 RepID=UPI0025770D3E|nr:7TM diverse intracellular signaling domain-containing protein [Variovorax sp. J31P179]MDM0085073.1 7TM diverse intracellular signaling domain-containing protein [Variovorax sp. J31P179]
MPYQEHLPQARRQLADRGRLPGAQAWLAGLIGACCVFLIAIAIGTAQAQPASMPMPVVHVEAARGNGWHDPAPPADGWTPVTLPDSWAARWPGFDSVVWYRLSWDQPAQAHETGLLMDYLNMAGEVSLNGTPIARDHSLVEPLTRAWNTPRFWLLASPLLRPGANTLLIRVSGFAAYQAGLGPVSLGAPAAMQARYERERLLRRDLQFLGLAISAAVSAFFAALWLMRRRETAYGWFALMSVLWLFFGFNQVATSPWPFASNHGWQALNTSLLLAFSLCFMVFTLRFCNRRKPRLEIAALIVVALGWIDLWTLGPATLATHRAAWTLVGGLLTMAVGCGAIVQAWRTRERAVVLLAPFMAVSVVAAGHDLLAYTQVIDSNVYYAAMSSYALLLGMALIQAGHFVTNLQRIENFNTELIEEVNAAKAELATTLAQRHALELAHARHGERVNLVSDLHDGLGGILVGSIATLERTPENLSTPQLLGLLKSLRDDLRLIIDVRGHDDRVHALGELLAPVRHRLAGLLEANNIECRWQISGIDSLVLPPSQNLDLLRFLQEALTNVLKHSSATQAHVAMSRVGAELRIGVRDDGTGFMVDAPDRVGGAGLRSMHARARRLGGDLLVQSHPGLTELVLRMRVVAVEPEKEHAGK